MQTGLTSFCKYRESSFFIWQIRQILLYKNRFTDERSSSLLVFLKCKFATKFLQFVTIPNLFPLKFEKMPTLSMGFRFFVRIFRQNAPTIDTAVMERCFSDTSDWSRIFQTRGTTPEFGLKTFYLARFLPKTAWKWKKFNREESANEYFQRHY